MRLAIIDPHDQVLIAWPSVNEAHRDIAALLATRVYSGRFSSTRRRRLEAAIRGHLLELQEQVRTVA